MTRPYEWILSGLDLTEPDEIPKSGYWFKHYGDDWDFGEPAAINSTRETLALDGDDEVTDRYGNREVSFTVAICGYTSGDIHDGERVLAQRIGVPGVLEYLPPESGPRSLYRVRTSKMTPLFDDLDLVMYKYVAYRVTLRCLPFAYPETTITETFTPGTATITVVDACTANTNWPGTTAVTFLSQSAVRKGPVAAVSTGGHPTGSGLYGGQYGVATYVDFTGTVGANNYMYIDFASALSGFGQTLPPTLVVAGKQITALASQLQADGYMRYFYTRTAGPLKFYFQAYGMASGDTANFYVDEFGTANVLPSGSLLALTTKGSVRCEANLRVSHPSTGGLGETLIYADPTMLTHGWNPNVFTSIASAPDGTYWIYAQPTASYNIGDVFSLTVAGQTVTTRTEHTHTGAPWIPFGPFQLGGNKSRRLGTVTGIASSSGLPVVALLKNGVGTGYTAVAARLFRQSEDSALVHARLSTSAPNQSFWIEPASIDVPEPGMFTGTTSTGSDATSALSLVKSWAFPRLIPPTTALYVQCDNTASPSVTVTHRPPFHTLAAEY